jgi:hypothetical protein
VLQKAEEKQREQDIEDAFAARDSNEEDRDPTVPFVFMREILRPQRIKHLPARDCYFTAEEAEAGDPRVVEDPINQTTDSENELGEGWDPDDPNDEEFDLDVEMEDIEMVQRDHNMSPSR